MVAVRTKILASLTAFALAISPLGLGSAGAALETIEPECYPAEDGTGAYLCEFPDTCEEGLDEVCDVPAECELVDEHIVRCQPSKENATSDEPLAVDGEPADGEPTVDVLIHPPEQGPNETELGQPMAECGLDIDTHEFVCEPPTECEGTDRPVYCQAPDECEETSDGLFRCVPGQGRELPEQALENRNERSEQDDRGGPQGSDEDPKSHDGETQDRPDCEPGSERGVVVCTPAPSCLDRLGDTDACTPPPECEDLGDGTFRCEIPDRVSEAETDLDTGEDEDPFSGVDPEARAKARAEIGQGIRDAAESFSSELDAMRADYQQRLDDLRTEYQDAKDELRVDYADCREQIPSDADTEERNQALQSCLAQAREDLASLRADMRERHDQLKQTVKERAEEARSQTCAEAETIALNAVADHGLFTANPADLVPDRALELCPTFADFDRGGEL